jgi:hypothetical protein
MQLEEDILRQVAGDAVLAVDPRKVAADVVHQEGVELLERGEISGLVGDHQRDQRTLVGPQRLGRRGHRLTLACEHRRLQALVARPARQKSRSRVTPFGSIRELPHGDFRSTSALTAGSSRAT